MPGLDELSRQATRLLTNPPVNRQDFQSAIDDLNKAITVYKSEGHPKREFLKATSSDMQFININGIESQIRQWETNIKDMKDAPPLPSASSTQRAPAEVPAQGPSTPRITPDITAFDQARINAALERTDPIQYWTNLKAAADVYIAEKIKGGVTASDPEEQIDQRRLEKVSGEQDNISRGTIDHIYELLGSGDGHYTLGEMDKVSKYAQWAIDKQNQADATRQREAEAYQEQRTNPSGRLQFAPAPIDMNNPQSVLKALFNSKADEQILKRGQACLDRVQTRLQELWLVADNSKDYVQWQGMLDAQQKSDAPDPQGDKRIEEIQRLQAEAEGQLQGSNLYVKSADSAYVGTDALGELKVLMRDADLSMDLKIRSEAYRSIARGILEGRFELGNLTPTQKAEMAVKLFMASAEMRNETAMGEIGMIAGTGEIRFGRGDTQPPEVKTLEELGVDKKLITHDPGLASHYFQRMAKSLGGNFDASSNGYVNRFIEVMGGLKQVLEDYGRAPGLDRDPIGLAPEGSLKASFGILRAGD